MSKKINLRIVVQNAVEGTMYALQKGKGPNYETVQAQIGNGRDLNFEFGIQLKQTKGRGFSLGGPFVQGPEGTGLFTSTSAAMPGRVEHHGTVAKKFHFLKRISKRH